MKQNENKETEKEWEPDGKKRRQQNLIPMNKRTPEERRMLGSKGGKAASQKRKEKFQLQKTMQALLNVPVRNDNQRKILRDSGFKEDILTNQMLLVTALFRKAITGDTNAIKQITEMMEKLDLVDETENMYKNGVTINLFQTGQEYIYKKDDEQDILKAEEEGTWLDMDESPWDVDDSDDDWGDELYDP